MARARFAGPGVEPGHRHRRQPDALVRREDLQVLVQRLHGGPPPHRSVIAPVGCGGKAALRIVVGGPEHPRLVQRLGEGHRAALRQRVVGGQHRHPVLLEQPAHDQSRRRGQRQAQDRYVGLARTQQAGDLVGRHLPQLDMDVRLLR